MASRNKIPALPAAFTQPRLRKLIRTLSMNGHTPRLVGGCVRDWLLRRPIGDIDIAIDAPPDDILRLLQAAKIHAIPTGIDHGTVTAVIGKNTWQITSLRQDVTTDGRHAVVKFGTDWHADAARRDFTVNALYYDFQAGVIDPLNGMNDLRAKRLRFIGDARQRIREDYLRILRLFRFYAQWDVALPRPDILRVVRAERGGLKNLSAERVRDELQKLLSVKNPLPALRSMEKLGVLATVLPGAKNVAALTRLLRIAPQADWVARLAALGVVERKQNLALSNAQTAFLTGVTAAFKADDLAFRRALYTDGAALFLARAQHAFATKLITVPQYRRAVTAAKKWRAKKFPLRGVDLLAIGFTPGPNLGATLRAVETWWIEKNFRPTKKQCLGMAKVLRINHPQKT